MKNTEETKDQELLEKLIRGRWTNLSEWFEKIIDDFCKEQAVEQRVSDESIDKFFYIDFTEQFLWSLPTLLFKFLIEKGVGPIIESRPSLHEPPPNCNWAKKQKKWEKFITEREWEYFLRK